MNLDDMMASLDEVEAEAKAKHAEEERLFGPFLDLSDEKAYPKNSPQRVEAMVKMNRRWSAMAAHERGATEEQIHAILNPDLSQLVTNRTWQDKRRTKSDRERGHLRRELTKAIRNAEKKGDPSLVHQGWVDDLQSLYDYAGPMPESDNELTLDLTYRFCTIDTTGPFAPGNTKWQSHDDLLLRLSIRTVEFWEDETQRDNPEKITLAELAKRTGLSVGTLRSRYDSGVRGPDLWSGRNLGAVYAVDVMGTKMTLADAARAWGINVNTLRARLARGLKGEALFTKTDARTGSDKKPKRGLKIKEEE